MSTQPSAASLGVFSGGYSSAISAMRGTTTTTTTTTCNNNSRNGVGCGTLASPPTSVIINGRKRITSVFTDGTEVVEEYDVVTDALMLRKLRSPTVLGTLSEWYIEVGAESLHKSRNVETQLLVEALGSPEVVIQDDKEFYVFRIRNLAYAPEVFSVTVEKPSTSTTGEIVVRTSNKKYYKRLRIPELERRSVALDPLHLTWEHKHNTLIIKYKKPLSILASEAAARKERSALPTTRAPTNGGSGGSGGGDAPPPQCAQQ